MGNNDPDGTGRGGRRAGRSQGGDFQKLGCTPRLVAADDGFYSAKNGQQPKRRASSGSVPNRSTKSAERRREQKKCPGSARAGTIAERHRCELRLLKQPFARSPKRAQENLRFLLTKD
jgi:hypothetical protein